MIAKLLLASLTIYFCLEVSSGQHATGLIPPREAQRHATGLNPNREQQQYATGLNPKPKAERPVREAPTLKLSKPHPTGFNPHEEHVVKGTVSIDKKEPQKH